MAHITEELRCALNYTLKLSDSKELFYLQIKIPILCLFLKYVTV